MRKLTLLTIIIVLIGILPSLIQYGCFMVTKDFSTQQLPFIVEAKRMLGSGIPFWSWNTFIGSDFIGAYSFYTLTSPFVWFVCLFPYKYITIGITLALFLKILCAGWFSYFFFLKMGISKQVSIIGGLLYAFSSYSISNIGYYHFWEPLICFPILLYGIEKFLRREKYGEICLAASVFLVVFVNYYFMPGSLICGLLYTICRVFSKDIKMSFSRFAYAIVLVAVGIAASAFILLPTLYSMEGNERIEASSDSWLPYYFERIRVLFIPKMQEQENPMLLGTGWNSNAANLSVIGLLLAIIYCIRHNDWMRWLTLIIFIFYISPLNGTFSLFTNSTYTRWAYAFTLFMILPSLKFLDNEEKFRLRHLIIYMCIAIGFIGIHYLYSNLGHLKTNQWSYQTIDYADNAIISAIFIFSLMLLFVFYKQQTPQRLLACLCVFSCFYFPLRTWMVTDSYYQLTLDNGQESKAKIGYINKYALNNHLERKEGNVFEYRTDFITQDKNVYQNLALLKNRPSVESYVSSCYHFSREILSLADTLNTPGFSHPNNHIDAFDALMSVREFIEYDDHKRKSQLDFPRISVKEKGKGYTIYANPHYIPMGFAYDSYIPSSIIDSIITASPQSNIPLQLLANLSIEKEDEAEINKYLQKGKIFVGNDLDSIVNARRVITCHQFSGTSKGFTASINTPKDAIVFFSVPYSKGFTAYVDGQPEKIFKTNRGLSSIVVKNGSHQIEFTYCPPGFRLGCIISLTAIICFIICFFSKLKDASNTNK